jgi:uncharacterized membrane protein
VTIFTPIVVGGAAVLAAGIILGRRGNYDVTRHRSHASRTVTIRADGDSLLHYFSEPANLPRFFHALVEARPVDDRTQRWTFDPGSLPRLSIDVDIVARVPGKRFDWKTTTGKPYAGGGSVTVTAAPGSRGTQVRLALHVDGRGAKAQAAVERLFGVSPGQLAMESLRNLKALVEAGERPTAARA